MRSIVGEPYTQITIHEQTEFCTLNRQALTSELSLHGLRQLRALHDTVQRRLRREHGVEVAHVHRARNARLERRLDLLVHEFLKVDVLREERVLLDLVCAVHTQTVVRVTREQSGEDAARVRADLVAEPEGLLQDLLVHGVGVLWR